MTGIQGDLSLVLVWAIRQQQLHRVDKEIVGMEIKLVAGHLF